MTLENTYVVGTLVQFYEIEMLNEHIDSCIQMLNGISNPENVTFLFTWSQQEYLERVDESIHTPDRSIGFHRMYDLAAGKLGATGCKVRINKKTNQDRFYNIARFRRDLNYNWCEEVDYVLWGETDSLWPAQTLHIIEEISKAQYPKHYITFAYRKNWDKSWDKLVHPLFASVPYEDNDDFILNNEASEKSYMSLERMNEINNIPNDQINVVAFDQPKADGSCLAISSDLIKSGVNIPHAIIHNTEDISFCEQAKLVMGDQFVQFHVSNILRVHNRRHPRKRVGILNEDNVYGFCDDRKGSWWKMLENSSNHNYRNLRQQSKFINVNDVINQIQGQNK